jgi:hypothetical protein
MSSSNLSHWGGLSVLLGGAVLVVKGAGIVFFNVDLDVVPIATLLFAIGLVGFSTRLEGRAGRVGMIGIILLYVAVAASLVNMIALAFRIPAPDDPNAPLVLRVTYPMAFFGILLGLIFLGLAMLRCQHPLRRWRAVPLTIGLLWFPLIGLGELISPDGFGMILAGFAWMVLGYVLWLGKAESAALPESVT